MLGPSSFVVESLIARGAEELFAAEALGGAFLRLTLLTYSDSLMVESLPSFLWSVIWVLLSIVRSVVASAAKELIAVNTLDVDFGVVADIASEIHS